MSLTTSSFSQNLTFGIKGGLGDAWIGHGIFNKPLPMYDNKKIFLLAYSAGGYANYSFGKISLQSELLFSGKGTRYRVEFTDANNNTLGTGTSTSILNYVDLPLLAKWDFSENETSPFVTIGLSPSVFIGGNYKAKFASSSFKYKVQSSSINAFNMSYILSAGLDIKKYVIELRYTGSISNIFPSSKTYNLYHYYNNTILLMLGRKIK